MSFLRRKLQPVVPPAARPADVAPRLRQRPGQSTPDRAAAEHRVIDAPAAVPAGAIPIGAPGDLRILVICTANISRSPLGEAFLQDELGDVARVTSAGVRAAHHLGVDPRSVAFADLARGIDLTGHRPRQVTAELLAADGRDLILVMTRSHIRELVDVDPSATRRAFTFKEFAHRSETAGSTTAGLGALVAALGANRTTRDLLGDDPRDDIEDPYGRSSSTFQRVATEIDDLCIRIARTVAFVAGSAQ